MSNFMNVITGIGLTDVIDVAIVAFVAYKVIGFIRETRAEQLAKGILVLVIALFMSEKLHLYTLNWILKNTLSVGLVALVVVFQPELRRGLEYIGRSKLISNQFTEMNKEKVKEVTSILVKAVDYFSSHKVGALMIIEREITLNDIAETGTVLDAEISEELIGNIFYEGAPLHDGAAILRGERILAAGCVLPLTQNKGLSKELGTRHRAGIGITENSDAVAIIVSEESGIISIAMDGKLSRFLDLKTVEKTLLNLYLSHGDTGEKGWMQLMNRLRRRQEDEKHHDQ